MEISDRSSSSKPLILVTPPIILANRQPGFTHTRLRSLGNARARRRLGVRLALHEQLLALWCEIANVLDGDHNQMVELVEQRAGVVEQLERPKPSATPRPTATSLTMH